MQTYGKTSEVSIDWAPMLKKGESVESVEIVGPEDSPAEVEVVDHEDNVTTIELSGGRASCQYRVECYGHREKGEPLHQVIYYNVSKPDGGAVSPPPAVAKVEAVEK